MECPKCLAVCARLPTFTLVNSGAVSQSFDGDTRAAYALLDDDRIEIRRVEYDIEAEIRLLRSDDPIAQSTAETLRTGRYVPVSMTSP
jgi:diadenosine tetraphosphatase ApaH/serine/threonine PP2A family protein phosphatase